MAYELKIGNNISTTDPTKYRKCTPAKIKAWWEAVKQNVPNYDNYNWHLVGGMANGSQSSKDADVVITPLSGEVYDANELPLIQSILTSSVQLALDNSFFLDLKATPYLWSSALGIDRDWFRYTCWDRISITIDGEEIEVKNIFNKNDCTIEQQGALDLWKITWANDTGSTIFPFGSDEKAKTYGVASILLDDWVAQLDI